MRLPTRLLAPLLALLATPVLAGGDLPKGSLTPEQLVEKLATDRYKMRSLTVSDGRYRVWLRSPGGTLIHAGFDPLTGAMDEHTKVETRPDPLPADALLVPALLDRLAEQGYDDVRAVTFDADTYRVTLGDGEALRVDPGTGTVRPSAD